jgi:hypothetical protein
MDPTTPPADVDLGALTMAQLAAVIRNDTEAYPQAATVEVPAAIEELLDRAAGNPPDDAPSAHRILEANGFNAIRAQIIGAFESLVGLPLEAIEAAIAYNEAAASRLRLDVNQRAGEALGNAERELELLRVVHRMRKDAKRTLEGWQARDRITAG